MKILIADDEALARARIRQLLSEQTEHEIVAEATHGRDVLEHMNVTKPELILLDIRMPGMDGIETAHHLAAFDHPPAVIFTTAYDQYALDAFDTHAVGYLLKPIRKEKLLDAIKHASQVTRAQLQQVQQQTPEQARRRTHISARMRGSLVLIEIERIRYFQAEDKYVTVGYDEGEVLIEESLKSLEPDLGDEFIRVHRNALIAVSFIRSLEKRDATTHVVNLDGVEHAVEVSRRHLAEVRRLIKTKAS